MTDSTASASRPVGAGGNFLLSGAGALTMLAVAGVGAWQGFGLPVFLAGIVLALTAVTRGWSRAALSRLDYGRRLSAARAFPGDTIEVEATLDNRKLLPLSWVGVAEPLAEAIAPDPAALPPGMTLEDGRLAVDTALMWYQRARWSYRLECRRRGYHRFGPAEVASSDLFGIFRRTRRAPGLRHVAVYPRVHPLGELGLPSQFPLGGVVSPNPVFQDPLRLRGVREYSPEVPYRHIHWKATARTGELQAKVFDPTCTLQLCLLLDASRPAAAARPGEDGTPGDDADFELALSATASLAWHYGHRGCAVGLFANTRLAGGGGQSAMLPPASGMDPLGDILLALARAEPVCIPFASLLDGVRPRLTAGSTLAVISGGIDAAVERRLTALRAHGFSVIVFLVGEGASAPGSFPRHRVVNPADLDAPRDRSAAP